MEFESVTMRQSPGPFSGCERGQRGGGTGGSTKGSRQGGDIEDGGGGGGRIGDWEGSIGNNGE